MERRVRSVPLDEGRLPFRDRLAAMLSCGDILLFAFSLAFACLFLTNSYGLPQRLFAVVIIPAAVLSWLRFSPIDYRRRSIGFAGRLDLVWSMVLTAAFVYLFSLCISSWLQADAVQKNVDAQWLNAASIMIFMTIVAFSVASFDAFLTRLVFVLCMIVALSALINTAAFLFGLPSLGDLISVRLINRLGMPGYFNSTNVSATYAVFFIAAAAIVVDGRVSRGTRFWLVPAALMLLVATLLTQSRGAYFGVFVGLCILLPKVLRTLGRRVAGLLAAGVVVAAIVFATMPQAQSVLAARGSSYRPEIWSIYADRALQRPLRGYGSLSDISIKLSNEVEIDQPHNLVLSAQVRGGLFGALAMIVLLIGSLYWSARYTRAFDNVLPLAVISTVASVGLFDYNLLITPLNWPWVTFWLPFAICAGAEIAVKRNSTSPA